MKFIIDKVEQEFIPIKAFRNQYKLPQSFGVSQFEPKNYNGLGSLDKAGTNLNELRDHILQLIPDKITLSKLMSFIDHIQFQFQTDLFNINDAIALKDVEIEFAVAGFGDVLRRMIYQMIPARANQQEMPSFESIYYGWVNDSIRVSSQIHEVEHHGETWQLQVINQVYGRVGLKIVMEDNVIYVADGIYLCPAEGFMYTLLKDTTQKIWISLI